MLVYAFISLNAANASMFISIDKGCRYNRNSYLIATFLLYFSIDDEKGQFVVRFCNTAKKDRSVAVLRPTTSALPSIVDAARAHEYMCIFARTYIHKGLHTIEEAHDKKTVDASSYGRGMNDDHDDQIMMVKIMITMMMMIMMMMTITITKQQQQQQQQ